MPAYLRKEVIGNATLYLGDALTVMAGIEPLKAAALIGDPPYCSGGFSEAAKRQAKGQGLRSETLREIEWFGGDNMTTAGLQWLLRGVAVLFKQHADSQGATVTLFCDWRMIAMLAPAIESAGLRWQAMPVWDKQALGLGTGFRAQHECMLHFAIATPEYHSARFGNVIRSPRASATTREHPTEKPLQLMRSLVEVQTAPGELILDPFMGGGSTGVAALDLDRRFVGIEHDPVHFETACRRIEEASRQSRLLLGEGAEAA
ncbi:site-specific DNA-methyltransferase [Sphingomonas sp. CBMAI 2297]|uniref:DNA-methyltransferase n=1 Tax=Sphingomonas sp. CBMAI 2297 TaxID=2991720 RepID=UPI00245755DA|nr:site-specific DNA-methyltransferase [Sphingomonas sp. CBMAI 2297]MDH4746658.1 site-specific DNA-methyltransferase [Sphingomonas sp. CBMAI 2297]